MHTRNEPGIDIGVVAQLNSSNSEPLTVESPFNFSNNTDDPNTGADDSDQNNPEKILEAAFQSVEQEGATLPDAAGREVLEGNAYDFRELAAVDRGAIPSGFRDDVDFVVEEEDGDTNWDVRNIILNSKK